MPNETTREELVSKLWRAAATNPLMHQAHQRVLELETAVDRALAAFRLNGHEDSPLQAIGRAAAILCDVKGGTP